MIAGGKCDDSKGYFVEPTIVESKDPHDAIMSEVKDLTFTWAHLEDAVGRDNVFPVGSVLKPEVGTLLRLTDSSRYFTFS